MNTDQSRTTAEQAAAFQKIWMESSSKMMEAAFTMAPNSPPPEVLRQIRSGIFQALAQSWEEFMRSPQFLGAMRQWMESAITFRKMTNDFMAKARNEMQSPSREDVDAIMLNVRHLEKRLLDRLDALAAQVEALKRRPAKARAKRPAKPAEAAPTTAEPASQAAPGSAEPQTL